MGFYNGKRNRKPANKPDQGRFGLGGRSFVTVLGFVGCFLLLSEVYQSVTLKTNSLFLEKRTLASVPNVTQQHQQHASPLQQQQQQQQQQQHHFLANLLMNQRKILLFVLAGERGFGSVVVNLALVTLHLHDVHGGARELVVDETPSQAYRWNKTHGIFSGYFETTFPIIQQADQEYPIIRQQIMDHPHMKNKEDPSFWNFTDPEQYTSKDFPTPTWYDLPVFKVSSQHQDESFGRAREMALQHFLMSSPSPTMLHHLYRLRTFQRFSQWVCQSVRVNDDMQARIVTLLQNAGVATRRRTGRNNNKDAWSQGIATTAVASLADSTTPAATTTSVAFHIRRGDKVVEEESRKYEAWEYVSKLLQVTTQDERLQIRHCFVATDDYSVVAELQSELTHNASIACNVSTLTPHPGLSLESGNREGGEEFILFLAQFDVLIHSTYFVGTFNSNVGKLAALFRGCPTSGGSSNSDDWKDPKPNFTDGQFSTKLNHYYSSYGVDEEDWFLRQW
jgi:hypothetical protein